MLETEAKAVLGYMQTPLRRSLGWHGLLLPALNLATFSVATSIGALKANGALSTEQAQLQVSPRLQIQAVAMFSDCISRVVAGLGGDGCLERHCASSFWYQPTETMNLKKLVIPYESHTWNKPKTSASHREARDNGAK